MQINPQTGLLNEARLVITTNADARPQGCVPELVVIHNISLPPGEFGGPWIEQLFTNCLPAEEHSYFAEICGLRVSAHLVIRRNGEVIQFVPFHERAWHAGQSSYQGRECCNDFSIGIELEGVDDIDYQDAQYASLVEVIHTLISTYSTLSVEHITGHSNIAPNRKTDPGPAFDWKRLYKQI